MFSTLLLYCIASFTVTVIPGPTMLLSLSNGVTKNKKIICYGILGAALSDAILISAVGLGLGALMATSETLFLTVKYCGVAYLLWLAYQLWKNTPSVTAFTAEKLQAAQAHQPVIAFRRSLFAALSNPKGLLFFGAFLPQFLDLTAPVFMQYVFFAIATIVIDIAVMLVYATAGFQAANYLSVSRLKSLNRTCASVLVAMASGLAFYKEAA
ncbi:LysE family translocator [Photobacterium galatheae]|uniref:Lysine transporter LysE n=1 Tax=Photobacterium galatheae TaxID=1654360 RepID=A0A066RV61_9GAMM|nr:LysE family translocator [Photobacterium galatheae]KDM91587.1 lysine transporter LysE [Photobacterium galatheae]MCM0149660.1 LysE family translocator [Photobacterium galatheae]